MRLVTWNVSHWQRGRSAAESWAYLRAGLAPDVALLQEASPPPDLDPSHVVYSQFGGTRRWGTAVYAPRGAVLTPVLVPTSHPGAIAVAEVRGQDLRDAITVISIYGFMEPVLKARYSITTLHRLLSDLTAVLDDPNRRNRIVLGGDLNAALRWDEVQRTPTHRLMFERIEAFGLASVLPYRDAVTPTWIGRRGGTGWQLDYLFVSTSLLDAVTNVEVPEFPRVAAYSDHRPIVVTLEGARM